ncbi:MAG: hypothetical protein R2932_01340 [Caldilineaceae bacterium]
MASKTVRGAPAEQLPQAALQRFNLETMSGVFPGTRTQIFQRVPLVLLAGEADAIESDYRWLQLLWYEEPSRCVAYLFSSVGPDIDAAPLLEIRLAEGSASFHQQLTSALQHQGYHVRTCGSCRFWQITGGINPDGLAVGHCGWRREQQERSTTAMPTMLSTQSHLALPCPHWSPVDEHMASAEIDAPMRTVANVDPMRRAAEEAEIRLSWWQRLRRRLRRWQAGRATGLGQPGSTIDWATALIERSGVGAGTEACFACQGRIANLGAVTVATAEDDKQTFSIWRCRNCYSLYLNNWVDRWERLDNLETEESYYRIAPDEALALLSIIYGHVGGEHPNRRHERERARQQFIDFIAGRRPLSHQIRQGR